MPKNTKTTKTTATETKATETKAKTTAEATAAPAEPKKIGRTAADVLRYLLKAGKPLTRAEIAEKTGITSGFTSLLGHVDPAAREPGSLAARGFIRMEAKDVENRTVVFWSITPAGKKALEAVEKAAKAAK